MMNKQILTIRKNNYEEKERYIDWEEDIFIDKLRGKDT